MPLEYIYTFAPRTHNYSGGSGFVLWPEKNWRSEKAARRIVALTGLDDYCLDNRPFYAFTKFNQVCTLTRTFVTPHYSTGQPVRFSHIISLDPLERSYFSEGPVYAMKRLPFQTEYGRKEDWPRMQEDYHKLPDKEPQSLPTFSKWKALTGDAGWCGWCVEKVLEGCTLFWVYDPEKTNGSEGILDLLDELFQLLPAERRWSVTFNTRVDLPTQIFQQILCVEESKSSIVDQVRLPKKSRFERINLHELSKTPAPDSDWVQYARTGKMHVSNFEAGIMVQDTGEFTQQELFEKFLKNYEHGEDLGLALDSLEKIHNLLDTWKENLDGRKLELEEHCGELGERQRFLAGETARIQGELDKRREQLEERRRDLENWEKELGDRYRKLEERRNQLAKYESDLQGKLQDARGELDKTFSGIEQCAEDCKGRMLQEIENHWGGIKNEFDAKTAGFCDRITKQFEFFKGQSFKQCSEDLQRVESHIATIQGIARTEFETIESIREGISNGKTELEGLKRDLTAAWASLCEAANEYRSATEGAHGAAVPAPKPNQGTAQTPANPWPREQNGQRNNPEARQ